MRRTIAVILGALAIAATIIGCSNYNPPTRPPAPPPGPQATVLSATGDIVAKAGDFRTLLGDPNNTGVAGQQAAGRREVNWDGAGARPFNNRDDFPPDFFNGNGLIYLGNGFRNDSLLFAEVNPTYANEFHAFSPKVMFSAVGTNVIEVSFHAAGTQTAAGVTGFGVVLSDVDLDNTTSLELFDKNRQSLGRFFAPKRSDANGNSFVGAKFDDPIVASVRITAGNGSLGAGVNDISAGGTKDLVVIDNVIYGEPKAIQP